MPDDRLFHKRLGHSVKVNSLTDFEELVWRAYILSADDFGVMRFSAIPLQADSDRMARKSAKTIQRALERIEQVQLIYTFEHQGRRYCFQGDWAEWQKIDYPRVTINPAPPLDRLTPKTQELFAKHPGGWGRKNQQPLGERSTNEQETFPERSGEISPKPLAVSRKPLAVSLEPVPAVADSRSKRPIFKGQRFVVFDWMLSDLSRMLGNHADAFDLHAWFYELDQRAVDANVVVPQRDGGKWLQERTHEEALRRGLPIAVQTNNPKTAGNVAAAARFIARGQR